jgi:hypothetical protein
MRLLLLALQARPARQAQRTDQGRETQSLHNQRRDYHAECEKDDQVALGEGGPVRQQIGQRHGRRQGYHAAHSAPSEYQ